MSGNSNLQSYPKPARTSEMKWRSVICTRKGWKVQMREHELSMSQNRYGWNTGYEISLLKELSMFLTYIGLSIFFKFVICKVHLSGKNIPIVHSLSTTKAHLPWQPPYSQHTSQQWYNCLNSLSSMMKILLYDLAFYGRVVLLLVS